MKKTTAFLLAAILLASCSHKKIIIFIKGDADINKDAKTITIKDAAGTVEKTVTYGSSGSLTLKLIHPGGESNVEITGSGYYVLNAKNDTIVGSLQHYSEKMSADTIRQETIKKSIDSLELLMQGKNVSAANHNYFVLPYQAVKVTDNDDAIIVAPFHQMMSVEKDGSKDPEIYRFFSLREIREKIEKQRAMTVMPVPPAK